MEFFAELEEQICRRLACFGANTECPGVRGALPMKELSVLSPPLALLDSEEQKHIVSHM